VVAWDRGHRWLGYVLADALTEIHYRFFPERRHAALANLAVIMPRAIREPPSTDGRV